MIKRILVGLGGTPYTTAEIRHAIDLAKTHNAEVTAVTVVDLRRVSNVGPVPIGGSVAAASLVNYRLNVTQRAINDAVELFKKACTDANVKHQVFCEAGDPFQELVSHWRYHDLTILALQSLFEYGVVEDPKDMLIQLISRGVRPIVAVSKDYRPVKRVLIAYNGSMESAKAMKYFCMQNLCRDVQVKIVCFSFPAQEANVFLKQAADYCRLHGLEAETELLPGDPSSCLLEYASEWNADLVVLGSTARARIFRRMIGDVALSMVQNASMPLFMTQ